MKRAILLIPLLLLTAEAQAISRHTSTSMSCDRVQATIRNEGVAIMRYQSKRVPGLQLFGRYVADGRYCNSDEAALPAYIRASDTDSCPVRECKHVDFDDDDGILLNR